MKTILITGGCGFLGHHIIEAVLRYTDWNIILLDKFPFVSNLNYLGDINVWNQENKRITFVWHDLLNPINKEIDERIKNFNYVLHLAAETDVGKSIENPLAFAQSNVVGTTNLYDWLRKKDCLDMVVNFSTDAVLGETTYAKPKAEHDAYNPATPYAGSKAAQEVMSQSMAKTYNMPACILRCTTLFGERQTVIKFIPLTIRNIMLGYPVTLTGAGPSNTQRRNWVHAREVANAIIYIFNHLSGYTNEIYHVTGKELSVYDVTSIVADVLKAIPTIKYREEALRAGHEMVYATQDVTLKNNGFKPSLPTDEAIKKMTAWYLREGNNKWLRTLWEIDNGVEFSVLRST